jgi:hypothetical protein
LPRKALNHVLALCVLAVGFTAQAATALGAETVYAKYDQVALRSEAGFEAPAPSHVKRGARLTVQECQGWFYKVRTKSGRSGYVLRLHATTVDPRSPEQRRGVSGLVVFGAVGGRSLAFRTPASSPAPRPSPPTGKPSMPRPLRWLGDLVRHISDVQVDSFLADGRVGDHWDGVYR